MNVCGAKTKHGGTCKRAPVKGGKRCKLHGGASPKGADSPHFKHGRYSKYAPKQIADKLATFENDDPLSLIPELQIQRALMADYLSRFEHSGLTRDDVHALMTWNGDIGKQVERISKMQNDTALTAAEVVFIQTRIVDLLVKYIDDPDKRRAFVEELFSGIPAEPAATTQPLQLTGNTRA
jgi:hypothetical protein